MEAPFSFAQKAPNALTKLGAALDICVLWVFLVKVSNGYVWAKTKIRPKKQRFYTLRLFAEVSIPVRHRMPLALHWVGACGA